MGKRIPGWVIAALAVAMVVAALVPALSNTPSREITLVVRKMAFYLESDPTTPNPTIEVKAGERVRIVVKNQDRGMTHDLAIPALDEAVDPIDWSESDSMSFSAPTTRGSYEYECQPHRLMMRGTIRVE